jgi:hypothetical protein
MTGEHLWSAWMGRLYPRSRFNVRERDHFQNILREHPMKSLDIKALVVCEPCNNGWMSDLENDEAKPAMHDMILHGRPLCLLPRGIDSISAFAFKAVVIADHMLPAHFNRFFSPDVRQEFSRTLRVPDGVQVWLASYSNPRGLDGIFKSAYFKPPLKTPHHFEIYVHTFSIGCLVIQVTSWRWLARAARRHFNLPSLAQHAQWDALVTEVSSHERIPIAWPPPQRLSLKSIHAFTYRKDFKITRIPLGTNLGLEPCHGVFYYT